MNLKKQKLLINVTGGSISLYIGLNMSLVPALSSDFGIGPCTFFCLELVPALRKNIGIGPVNFMLKKTQNYCYWSLHFVKILVLVPALCENIGIGATWHEMIGSRGTPLVLCVFF
jgi:hypothetical protein